MQKKRRSSAVCHDCHYHLLSFHIFHEFNPLAAIQYLDLLLEAIKNETYYCNLISGGWTNANMQENIGS